MFGGPEPFEPEEGHEIRQAFIRAFAGDGKLRLLDVWFEHPVKDGRGDELVVQVQSVRRLRRGYLTLISRTDFERAREILIEGGTDGLDVAVGRLRDDLLDGLARAEEGYDDFASSS